MLTELILLGVLLVVMCVLAWRALKGLPTDEATRVATEQRMAEWQLQQVPAQAREAMRRAAGGNGP